MVNLYCEKITREIVFTAEFLSWKQNETVKIVTQSETLEVNFNEKEKEQEKEQQ